MTMIITKRKYRERLCCLVQCATLSDGVERLTDSTLLLYFHSQNYMYVYSLLYKPIIANELLSTTYN